MKYPLSNRSVHWLAGLVALLLPLGGSAQLLQDPGDGEIDSIVALVDEDVILRSELDQAVAGIVQQIRARGEAMPPMNGHPLRLVIAGWPGSVAGKWLSKIVVRNQVHDGPKMTGTAYRVPCKPVAPGTVVPDDEMCIIESMPVKSLITFPRSGITHDLAQSLAVRGHAWAGDREVAAVHVSTNFGATWQATRLESPANRFAWQHWNGELNFDQVGYYEIWVLRLAGVFPSVDACAGCGTRTALLVRPSPEFFALTFALFKLGAVPFHMWVPDIYHGAPTAVTLFLGSAPKIAAFALAMRLLVDGLEQLHPDWQGMLVILAVLSMAVGNLAEAGADGGEGRLELSRVADGVLAGHVVAVQDERHAVAHQLLELFGFRKTALFAL